MGYRRGLLAYRRGRLPEPGFGQLHPERAAQRDQIIIEIIAGVVQHAWPAAVAHRAVAAVAIGDKAISARLGLQHVGKVFRAHGGLLHHDVVGPNDGTHHCATKFRLVDSVDGGRVVAIKLKIAGGAKSRAGVVSYLFHARFNRVQHLGGEGAHGALQLATVGDDIGGFACMDHGDGDHAGINRFEVAAHDGLERLHHLAGNWHWVQPQVRQRCMAALALDGNLELVAGSHHWPRAHGKFADRAARPVVHAKHRLHREFLKQAVLDHLARTTTAFFGRLEDQVNRAVKIAVFGEVLGCCQQHGGVTIMPTGVHLARVFTGVFKGVELLHRQCVHVGAQANRAAAGAAFDNAHHARGTHATMNWNAPLSELPGHQVGGADFFKTQLGVGMNFSPDGGNASGLGHDGVNDFHGSS